jgi:hypothetical protein
MGMTEANRVWNRAALEEGGRAPREGDRALAALLLAHGMVMNGGVQHATEALSADEMAAAAAGFRYFSSDSRLVSRFEVVFADRPSAFAPLSNARAGRRRSAPR